MPCPATFLSDLPCADNFERFEWDLIRIAVRVRGDVEFGAGRHVEGVARQLSFTFSISAGPVVTTVCPALTAANQLSKVSGPPVYV